MIQTLNTQTMEKQSYVTPAIEIVRLDTAPVLNSVSATGTYSIGYGGDGDGEEGD